jgi:hypothetical protein
MTRNHAWLNSVLSERNHLLVILLLIRLLFNAMETKGNKKQVNSSSEADRSLTCLTCGLDFLFVSKEQEFYKQRGFPEPRRCKPCRMEKAKQLDQIIENAEKFLMALEDADVDVGPTDNKVKY